MEHRPHEQDHPAVVVPHQEHEGVVHLKDLPTQKAAVPPSPGDNLLGTRRLRSPLPQLSRCCWFDCLRLPR